MSPQHSIISVHSTLITIKKIFHPTDQLESVFKEDNLLFALSYTKEKMDQEIERVSREMYRAFNGLNEGFQDVSEIMYFLNFEASHTFIFSGKRSDCH